MGVSPYTKERLEEAARASRTLSEALERLGVDPEEFDAAVSTRPHAEAGRRHRKPLLAASRLPGSMAGG